MSKAKNLQEAFKASLKSHIVSGTIKFSNLYCSQIQVFEAATKWVESTEGVVYAAVRTDGDSFVALDFRFDEKLHDPNFEFRSILNDYLKPTFKEFLGEDYIQAWSISRDSVMIK